MKTMQISKKMPLAVLLRFALTLSLFFLLGMAAPQTPAVQAAEAPVQAEAKEDAAASAAAGEEDSLGLFIFLAAIILLAIIVVVVVSATVSGTSGAISDEEDGLEE